MTLVLPRAWFAKMDVLENGFGLRVKPETEPFLAMVSILVGVGRRDRV